MNPLDNTSISPLSLEAMQMNSWMNDRTTFELKPQYSHMGNKWTYRKVSHKSLRYYVVSIVDVGFPYVSYFRPAYYSHFYCVSFLNVANVRSA